MKLLDFISERKHPGALRNYLLMTDMFLFNRDLTLKIEVGHAPLVKLLLNPLVPPEKRAQYARKYYAFVPSVSI